MKVTGEEYLAAVERGAKAAILQALGQPTPATAPSAAPAAPAAPPAPAGGTAPRPAEPPPSAPPAAAQQAETSQGIDPTTVLKTPDPGIKYCVKRVKVSGKKPQYVGCNLECSEGQSLYLRFTLNSNVNAAKWGELFLSFIRRLGLEEVTDSEQLVGRHLYFHNPKQMRNVQSVDGLCDLMGFAFHEEPDVK